MSATSRKGAESIRVGLLSYAHVGHAVAYSAALKRIDGVEFVAIYDEDEERGRAMASRFDVPEYHADAAAVIGRGDIQAVVVCSPTADHASLVIAAAEAGKHILCEKPIATRVEDANAMSAACEAAGVQLHIPFVLRFLPMAQRTKQMVAAGEIGEIYGMMGGNRGIPPLPPAYPGWITDPKEAGGGALIDHSVHVTDAMRFITGAEATRVFAECGTLFREELRVDDAAILLVTFDDEIAASIDPSWCIPKGNPYHYDFYLRILGADGVIAIDETRSALQVTRPGKEGRSFVLEGFGADANLEVVRHFVRCVREGEQLPPAASGVDGLRALEIALAGYESARTGQPVMLGGVVAS